MTDPLHDDAIRKDVKRAVAKDLRQRADELDVHDQSAAEELRQQAKRLDEEADQP